MHSMFYLSMRKARLPDLLGNICRIVTTGQYKESLMTIVT